MPITREQLENSRITNDLKEANPEEVGKFIDFSIFFSHQRTRGLLLGVRNIPKMTNLDQIP